MSLTVFAGVAGVVVVGIVASLLPAMMAASRRRTAQSMMPQWPADWPHYGEIFTWRRPRRGPLPWEANGSWVAWMVDTLYWLPIRLITFRGGDAGLIAVPTGDYLLGTGAIRIGKIPGRNWIERLAPLEAWMPRNVAYRHYALAGPTGAGKTTTLGIAVPFYAAYSNQSVVVNDVKLENGGGEYFAWFVDHWRRLGNKTLQFNPWAPNESLALEPVFIAEREEVDLIVAALTRAGKPGKSSDGGGNSQFFENAGKQLLTGLVLAARHLPRRYCTLPTVYRVLSMGARAVVELWAYIEKTYPSLAETEVACQRLVAEPEAHLEAVWTAADGTRHPRTEEVTSALALVDRSGVDIQSWVRDTRAECWKDGSLVAPLEGPQWAARLRDLRHRYETRRAQWETTVREMGTLFDQPMEPTLANIAMTALNTMSCFKAPELQRAFSRPEFQIVEVVRSPALFVIGSPQAKEDVGGKFVGSMCWSLLLNRVYERSRDKGYNSATAIDVIGLMDEMPALGLENLARLLATIRSYRAPMLGIYQSDNQLKQGWGEDYGTVLDNYVGQATLYSSAGETAKRTAERVGEAVLLKRQQSTNFQGISGMVGTSGGSVSRSAERVPRLTQADVTEMRINGRSLGPQAAISTSKDRPPFIYMQIPWWEDPVIRRGMQATQKGDRWTLPENRRPYYRLPIYQVENPDKDPLEPWIYAKTPAGDRIPDPHAHDRFRDTVDFIAPPEVPVLYDLTDPEFVPADLGLTPVTAETLQATIEKKLNKGAAGAAAPTSPPSHPGTTPAALPGAVPVEAGDVRLHFDLIRSLIDSILGLPQFPTAPQVLYEDKRYGAREVAEQILDAERTRSLCSLQGNLAGVPSSATKWPMPWWLVQGFQTALDFPSWVFMWLRHPSLGTRDAGQAQQTITGACELLDHLVAGIASPPHLWAPLLDAGEVASAGLRAQVFAFLEAMRDRVGRTRTPETLVAVWAEARAELAELTPDGPLSAADALFLLLTEVVVDFAAQSRATWADLEAFANPAKTPPADFAQRYADPNLLYPMPNVLILREQAALTAAMRSAIQRVPHRGPRLATLGATVRREALDGRLQAMMLQGEPSQVGV